MKLKPILLLFTVLFVSFDALAQQRLVVVGGGGRPADAMKRFVQWGGGQAGRFLVITWATAEPEASFAGLRKDLTNAGAVQIEHAATRPLDAAGRARFVEQIGRATAVFFSGGDQNRIMDVLADAELLELVRKRYTAGVAFGGTSAGAAAMSDPMMTGEADLKILDGKKVGVRKGLGFVPDVIFDQHFLARQRHNRLMGLVMERPGFLGVGVDENTAVLIADNRRLEVSGTSAVMLVDGKKIKGAMVVYVVRTGEMFDLKSRKPAKWTPIVSPGASAAQRR